MASAADKDVEALFPARDDGDVALRGAELFGQVEAFLYREAELMDSHAYDAWLELWDQEALYWVPSNSEDLDPNNSVSIIYERRHQLSDRVFRLNDKRMHSQSPKSRIIRVISNLTVRDLGNDTVVCSQNFVLGQIRGVQQETLFGRALHRLVRRDGDWRIRAKKVYLLNNDAPMRNVTFLL